MEGFTLIGVLFVYILILDGIRRLINWHQNRPKKVNRKHRHTAFLELP